MTHPSILILGTDAVLAAAPATPVQLMHACLRAGFSAVVPASWGDELIAARAIERLASADGPVVQCSCPLVAKRLAANVESLAPMVFCSVAPPVATAVYVRALYAPRVVEITYGGACPSATDPAIDLWVLPAELLDTLQSRGIDVAHEPAEFDSVLPPDRRRFYSEPGGVPSPAVLQRQVPDAELVELGHENFVIDLAQHLLSDSKTLISLAPALGCACSGARAGLSPAQGRTRLREVEPPRAPGAIVEHGLALAIERTMPESAMTSGAHLSTPSPADDGSAAPAHSRDSAPVIRATPAARAPILLPAEPLVAVDDGRRRSSSPSGPSRAVTGTIPQTRTGGRQLPRAYVARRRSSPRGMRQSVIRRAETGEAEGLARWKRVAWVAGAGVGLFTLLRLLL